MKTLKISLLFLVSVAIASCTATEQKTEKNNYCSRKRLVCLLRMYGPLNAHFNKEWLLPDIEKAKM